MIYNLLAFLALGGFHDTCVLSVIETIFKPPICKPLTADNRPGPKPWTLTRTVLYPWTTALVAIVIPVV